MISKPTDYWCWFQYINNWSCYLGYLMLSSQLVIMSLIFMLIYCFCEVSSFGTRVLCLSNRQLSILERFFLLVVDTNIQQHMGFIISVLKSYWLLVLVSVHKHLQLLLMISPAYLSVRKNVTNLYADMFFLWNF